MSISSNTAIIAFAIDGLLVLIAVVSIFWHGFNLGIDFTGGVELEVKAAQTIDVGKMRGDVFQPRLRRDRGAICRRQRRLRHAGQ